ncbi:RB39B protein, partial [Polypterus senegalus]
MESLWDYQFRIIMLGDSTVGKSSLLKRYTEDVFISFINQTVGVDFYVQFFEVEPEVKVKLQFWDTAGQERFRSVTRSYYRNSAGGLIVFDITNRSSFESVREWHKEVSAHVQPHKVILMLVGHKSDLEEERTVTREEGEKLAASLGLPYIETSAKTNSNVVEAFQQLSGAIYQALQSGELHLRKDWDGVKCGAARAQELNDTQPVPVEEPTKSCAC